jgi:molybdopterin-binding protein
VIAVTCEGVVAKVEMACGPYRIVSLMCREALEEQGIEPGVTATAIIKATTVIVDRD